MPQRQMTMGSLSTANAQVMMSVRVDERRFSGTGNKLTRIHGDIGQEVDVDVDVAVVIDVIE